MKILTVNISDIQGGAARAAYRLHKALLVENVDSEMLVAHKYSDDFRVRSINHTKKQKGLNLLRPTIDNFPVTFYKSKSATSFSPAIVGFSGVIESINNVCADIVHLHWICASMVRLEDLAKINAPIVWSLHDMWVFTGGCHYDEGCGAYEQECGNCVVLGSGKDNDLSKKVYKRKEKVYSKIDNMTIVGLSSWLSLAAKKSSLLENKRHINLPNPIDTSIFKPFDKIKARELCSLPQDTKLVLFAAMGATSDPRKGFNQLQEVFYNLKGKQNIELVVLGSSEPEISQNFGLKTHYLGKLIDNIGLITLYSAVDVVVVPSLQENLSNVIMESLSCGTPVVGFNIGGNGDMVEHKKSGYLVEAFKCDDMAEGILWVVDDNNHDKLSKYAREKVLKEFDSKVVSKKYIELYKEVLNG